jgi:hypothetical protein
MALLLWWSAGLSLFCLFETKPKAPPPIQIPEVLQGFENLLRSGRSLPRDHIKALGIPRITSLLLHLQAEGLPLLGPLGFLKAQVETQEKQQSKIRVKSQGAKAQALILSSLTPILALVLRTMLPDLYQAPAFRFTLSCALVWTLLGLVCIYFIQQRALRGGQSHSSFQSKQAHMERLHLLAAGIQGGLPLSTAQTLFAIPPGEDPFIDELQEKSRTNGTGVLQPLLHELSSQRLIMDEHLEKALEALPTTLLFPLFFFFAPSAISLLTSCLYITLHELHLEP